jgi:hypothetical protein
MCPFLSDPFEECLCRDMGSLNVLAVIRICGEDFEVCEIYMTWMKERETGSGRNDSMDEREYKRLVAIRRNNSRKGD